jgi:hypothetical protein
MPSRLAKKYALYIPATAGYLAIGYTFYEFKKI